MALGAARTKYGKIAGENHGIKTGNGRQSSSTGINTFLRSIFTRSNNTILETTDHKGWICWSMDNKNTVPLHKRRDQRNQGRLPETHLRAAKFQRNRLTQNGRAQKAYLLLLLLWAQLHRPLSRRHGELALPPQRLRGPNSSSELELEGRIGRGETRIRESNTTARNLTPIPSSMNPPGQAGRRAGGS